LETALHGRTTEITHRLRSLDQRLGRVTINICGPAPETQKGQSVKPTDEHLHEKFNTVESWLAALEDEMSRLESVVGSHQPAKVTEGRVAANF